MKKIYLPALLTIACISFGFVIIHGLKAEPAAEKGISYHVQQLDKQSGIIKELTQTIPSGKAKALETILYFPVGELNISPGIQGLSNANLRYYRDRWEPNISYEESGQQGYLKYTYDRSFPHDDYGDLDQSIWDIQFNKNIPNDLTIKCIAGEGRIDLHGCNLKVLDFSMTAGEMDINLSNTSVHRFTFSALAGDAVIDLSGKWQNDLHANIKGGVGELVVLLPAKTGIQFYANGLIGDIDADGFHKDGRRYTNEWFGKTEETLYIDFTLGIGSLEIQLIDN